MNDFQKTHNVPPEVDFESSRSPEVIVLKTVPICIVQQYYPHDNIVCIHKYDEYMKSIDSDVCHKLWYFTDHKISGRPILAKYKTFQNNLRAGI